MLARVGSVPTDWGTDPTTNLVDPFANLDDAFAAPRASTHKVLKSPKKARSPPRRTQMFSRILAAKARNL